MTIRYGLIGSGMMGQEHIRNLKILEGCDVTAIADPDGDMSSLSVETSGRRAIITDQLFSSIRGFVNLCARDGECPRSACWMACGRFWLARPPKKAPVPANP